MKMLGKLAGNPRLLEDLPLEAGTTVEHKDLPAVPLTIISGPHEGVTGVVYRVLMPGGKMVRVLRDNLIL
jgi:hypothetical protein